MSRTAQGLTALVTAFLVIVLAWRGVSVPEALVDAAWAAVAPAVGWTGHGLARRVKRGSYAERRRER